MRRTMNRMRALPFVITAVYLPYMAASFAGDAIWYLANQILFVSPAVCLVVLWIGRPFRFCKWWMLQCVLPIVPNVCAIWQHFNGINVRMALSAIISVFVFSIINGIGVYYKCD